MIGSDAVEQLFKLHPMQQGNKNAGIEDDCDLRITIIAHYAGP